MIASRISSAWMDLRQRAESGSGAQVIERLFGRRSAPLGAAIDAPRHQIATADAGTISYYADTSASGRPLVLLHGIHAAGSSYEMRPLFESFRGERPVYALDLPGYGFSERDARPYTPATYVHAIEHLLRNVALERGADIIALSLTSEYAAKVAVEMQEMVRSLVLVSPTGFASKREVNALERWARGSDKRLSARLSALPAGALLYEALVSRPSLRYYLKRSFESRVDDGLLAYAYETSHQPNAWRAPLSFITGGLFPSGSALSVYGHVKVPTLVLYDQDPYTGFGELAAFASDHPNFQVQRVQPTRGLPQFDAPQQTAEALRGFYRELEQPTKGGKKRTQGTRFIGSA